MDFADCFHCVRCRSPVINAMHSPSSGLAEEARCLKGTRESRLSRVSRDTGAPEVRLALVWRRNCDDKWEVTVLSDGKFALFRSA